MVCCGIKIKVNCLFIYLFNKFDPLATVRTEMLLLSNH